MFSRSLGKRGFISFKHFSITSKRDNSICIIGGAGGIGRMLSLLLKMRPLLVNDIRIYDIQKCVPGVAMDLSHINTPVTVKGYTGRSQLKAALRGADIVVIAGGISKVPIMTRDNLLTENANILQESASACAEMCPDALINIITNPINSCVPIFCETMRKLGAFNPMKVIGVTTLDTIRISTFISNIKGLDPREVSCPVVGGHSVLTMVPLLSQCKPRVNFSENETASLFSKIRVASNDVMEAKFGKGTTQIAMAYSAAYFIFNQLKAVRGKADIIQCGYVLNNTHKTKFFTSKLLLGVDGIVKDIGLGKLSNFEQEKLHEAIPLIISDVEAGEKYVR